MSFGTWNIRHNGTLKHEVWKVRRWTMVNVRTQAFASVGFSLQHVARLLVGSSFSAKLLLIVLLSLLQLFLALLFKLLRFHLLLVSVLRLL